MCAVYVFRTSLCLINQAICHENTRESTGIHIIFLPSIPDGVEWSTSGPSRFTPIEIVPCTHWRGGWVDGEVKDKVLLLPGIVPLYRPSRSPSMYLLCRHRSAYILHCFAWRSQMKVLKGDKIDRGADRQTDFMLFHGDS
jgi:hypothetical protein